MKVLLLILLSLNFLTTSCVEEKKKILPVFKNKQLTSNLPKLEDSKTCNTYLQSFDTLSFNIFWNDFVLDIENNNKSDVIINLEFPVRALYIVLFKFAYDCDTASFIANEEKFLGLTFTANNIEQYYDFIFSNILKSFIKQTTSKTLLNKGRIYEDKTGLTYQFFPRDYLELECSSDYCLTFNIYEDDNKWKINIGGL